MGNRDIMADERLLAEKQALEGIINAAQKELDAWRIPKGDEQTGYKLTLSGRIAIGLSELVQLRALCASAPEIMAELDSVRQQRDAAIAALEDLEWSRIWGTTHYCPKCLWPESEGHAPDCKLDAALRQARG